MFVGKYFKYSASIIALRSTCFCVAVMGQAIFSSAMAASIHYQGLADIGFLQNDLTGGNSVNKSLYPQETNSQSGNILTVEGNSASLTAIYGQDVWNTTPQVGETVVAPYVIYGGIRVDDVQGDIANNSVIVKNLYLDWSGNTAAQGANYNAYYSGGGVGGMGAGSVFGGLSIGKVGGTTEQGGEGGAGGDITNNAVVLQNVSLIGGNGGRGGDAAIADLGPFQGGYGGSGAGGLGGGSIVGGLSIGGAGGNGNGGNGGNVSNNTIVLQGVTLIGGKGGIGGIGGSGIGGTGIAGLEGGSVFGGISIGGGGDTDDDAYNGVGGYGGKVSHNNIIVAGVSAIEGSIYGGYSQGGKGDSNTNYHGLGDEVTNNSITLEGENITIGQRNDNGTLTNYGSIYGGYSLNGGGDLSAADVFTGNRLNLNGYRGTLSGIHNFEYYNWILPRNVANGESLVTIADGGTPVDLTNTKHSVALYNDGTRLNGGDKVTLINKTQGSWSASNSYILHQGYFLIYDATLTQSANGEHPLELSINSPVRLNEQSKSYLEGRAAALGIASQGSDLISSNIENIRAQAITQGEKLKTAFVPFIVVNGASQRYDTGSHIDIKGFNMLAGVATGFNMPAGHQLTLGAFFEYGYSTFDTYNSFSNATAVYGDGNGRYTGGGVFGRIDFAGTGLNRIKQVPAGQSDGLYLEASLRAGRISSTFDVGNDIGFAKLMSDYRGSYDSASTYYGGHAAAGYVFNFDDKNAVDVYGRYLWTYLKNDTVTVAYDKLFFDHALSSRLQLGGRYTYAYNENFKPYIGAAYEYEFDGKIKGSVHNLSLDQASLKGSSGIFEAGFILQPIATNKGLSIDINFQGFLGQRQGGGGGAKIKYQF